MKNLIEVKNLSKSFDKGKSLSLEGISFVISEAKLVGIVGPDGAGKSTLIRLMAALLKPTDGSVSIFGFDTMRDSLKIFENISYMPQRFGLYEDLTVLQNLNLYSDLQGILKEERRDRFGYLLEFTGLKDFTDRLASRLSGGMRQKLGLACTLLRSPKALFLDEPTVGVDPISRRELWKIVDKLKKEGILIFWSSAYLSEAQRCEEVLILSGGRLLYHGSPNTLTKKMEGRSFLIKERDKRAILSKLLEREDVIDSVIQGDDIRVVLKEGCSGLEGMGITLKGTSPRFEDAFLDILGGMPRGRSPLEKMERVKEESEKVVSVSSLTKYFKDFKATDKVTFDVKVGEVFGLLGPNGAGKSTTFKMLSGLLTPTSGEAKICGLPIKKVTNEVKKKIGYMAQKFSLYNNMSVIQNLNFFSGIYPISYKKRREMIDLLISIFNLLPFLNRMALKLPLGYKQRLALSCAICHSPSLLFLDEPTSGVDPITRREFWNHINAMVERGVSVIITTHFMEEAECCDRIGLMSEGRLVAVDTPDNLKRSVRSEGLKEPTLEDAFIKLTSGVGER